MQRQVIITYLSGPKNGQVDKFPYSIDVILHVGHGRGAHVLFPPFQYQGVTPQHCTIAGTDGPRPKFKIMRTDRGSLVILNGEIVDDQVRLYPGDVVTVGPDGAAFEFELAPRGSLLLSKVIGACRPSELKLRMRLRHSLRHPLSVLNLLNFVLIGAVFICAVAGTLVFKSLSAKNNQVPASEELPTSQEPSLLEKALNFNAAPVEEPKPDSFGQKMGDNVSEFLKHGGTEVEQDDQK